PRSRARAARPEDSVGARYQPAGPSSTRRGARPLRQRRIPWSARRTEVSSSRPSGALPAPRTTIAPAAEAVTSGGRAGSLQRALRAFESGVKARAMKRARPAPPRIRQKRLADMDARPLEGPTDRLAQDLARDGSGVALAQ